MARELASLVPRQRVQHELGQAGHLLDYGVLHLLGAVPVRQVEQHREAGRALHERPDRRLVGRAGDQVALPVAGHGAVLDLRRPLADHDHGVPEARLALVAGRPGTAGGAARSELPLDVAPEPALRLDVDGLVYGFVASVHGIIIGELAAKPAGNLLGRPMPVELLLDRAPQPRVVDLARLRPFEAAGRELLRAVGAVAARRPCVRPDLAADGGWAPAQSRGYGSDGIAGAQAVGDGDSLILR